MTASSRVFSVTSVGVASRELFMGAQTHHMYFSSMTVGGTAMAKSRAANASQKPLTSGGATAPDTKTCDLNQAHTVFSETPLRYVSAAAPGFLRRRTGKKGFIYLDTKNRIVCDEFHLARIKSLAIPPAWIDVWICQSPVGHLQAT